MKVSAYATVYNNSNTIEKSLKTLYSTMNDHFDEWELVVVDNFSTDGTWDILCSWKKEHRNIKLLRFKCWRGKGRNIALANTSGKYVFYVDLDCIFEKYFGLLISKEIEICGTNDVIFPYAVTSKKNAVEIGWKNLNWGEDLDFFFRAARSFHLKTCLIYPFSMNEKMNRPRGMRYARGIKFIKRMLVDQVSAMYGCRLGPLKYARFVSRARMPLPLYLLCIGTYPLVFPFTLSIKLISEPPGETRISKIYPEELGFDEMFFFYSLELEDVGIKKILSEVTEVIKHYNGEIKIKRIGSRVFCYKDERILKKMIPF